MPEHQKDPLLQLLELSMADIEQGWTYNQHEVWSALAQRRSQLGQSGSHDWEGFFDSEPASSDFMIEREPVIAERRLFLDDDGASEPSIDESGN